MAETTPDSLCYWHSANNLVIVVLSRGSADLGTKSLYAFCILRLCSPFEEDALSFILLPLLWRTRLMHLSWYTFCSCDGLYEDPDVSLLMKGVEN